MEGFIKMFDETHAITDVVERTKRRDVIVNQMCECAIGASGEGCDMRPGVGLGETAAFLVILLAKLPCMPPSNLANVLSLTLFPSSKYIRNMARQLVGFLLKGAVADMENEMIIAHVLKYTMDGEAGNAWVWNCLVNLCPLSEDAFQGSMVAQCVGDALGFVVEGHPATTCQTFIKEFMEKPTIPTWVRIKGLTFGQYSDDSQLARETYVSFLQAGGKLDPVVYGLRIGCLFQPGHYRIVGYGGTTARAGEALFRGHHHSTTGSATTNGNGSAMRSGPLGLIMSQFPLAQLVETTRIFSSITHASEACIDGSIAIALGTRASMATRAIPFHVSMFLNHIAEYVTNTGYKKEILTIPSLMRGKSDEAAKTHIAAYGCSMKEDKWGDGISSGVRQSSLWALYAFCKYPDNYKECIAIAIMCGGDVDTTAAMAGALVGARLGYASVPGIWRDTIHDLNDWKLGDITGLVNKVFNMVSANKNIKLKG